MISLLCKVIFFLSEKRMKAQEFASFTCFLLKKLQEIKFIIRYTQKEDAS